MRVLVAASWLPALVLMGALAHGRPTEREPCRIAVSTSGTDTVGSRFTLSIKERITKSPLYRLVRPDERPVGFIRLVSVDADEPPEGNRSAIAMEFFVGEVDNPC